MLRRSDGAMRLLRQQFDTCTPYFAFQQRCGFAKAKGQKQEDSDLQQILEVSIDCAYQPCPIYLLIKHMKPMYLMFAVHLQYLKPQQVKPLDLSPEEQLEWNNRAKEYSRLKMAEHRAWQKVS